MSFSNQNPAQVRSFISEAQLEERRKKRQEEWTKVRQPHQPEDAPEEEYDCRSLYHRLQEQKDKKQAEFEEAHKLKNMIKGLDNDEVQFLDLVDKSKEEMEAKILSEEGKAIEEYRRAVATLTAEAEAQKFKDLKTPLATSPTSSTAPPSYSRNQQAILAGVIKRKSSSTSDKADDAKRIRHSSEGEIPTPSNNEEEEIEKQENKCADGSEMEVPRGMMCVGVLPGLSAYTDSSDSDLSSSSETFDGQEYDLVGRLRSRGDIVSQREKT